MTRGGAEAAPRSWMSQEIPHREDCVLRNILERRAHEQGNQVFLIFENGESWTFAETLDRAARSGAALHKLGVRPGDPVLSWLPNGPEALTVWFGANWIGAVYSPINTAYRGSILEHVVNNSGASIMVAHADLVERLKDIACSNLKDVLITAPKKADDDRFAMHDFSLLQQKGDTLESDSLPCGEPWHTQSIIYTSGTTGPSKGVLSSYTHLATAALVAFEGHCSADDRYLVNLPLFHVGGTMGVYGMLLVGGSAVIVDRFNTQRFWGTVRKYNITSCTLLGVMASFLTKAPPSSEDRLHSLRNVILVPFGPEGAEFAHRFGVTSRTMFNMTEVSIPLLSPPSPTAIGGCGRPRPGVEARLVDEHDCEVGSGQVGELILRTNRPWAMNHGYHRMPEATAAAWRNGWFHTGDAFRKDDAGEYYFVDRTKDSIRRRGENISSFEVEAEILCHPDVLEAAVVGVSSPYSEDDVLAAIALSAGATLSPAGLIEFLIPRLPHFMVPRYIRIMGSLPLTPTNKVQKHELRAAGVTTDTWDREAHGLVLKIDNLQSSDSIR